MISMLFAWPLAAAARLDIYTVLSASLILTVSFVVVSYLVNGTHAIGSFPKPHPSNKLGPEGLPVIGHLHLLLRYREVMPDFIYVGAHESGLGTNYITLPFTGLYFTFTTPEAIEFILRTKFESFEKGSQFRERFHDVLGNGIFNSDGEQWRKQRKTAANIFNVNNFRDFVEKVFQREMSDLDLVLTRHANQGTIIDLHDAFFRFTLDGFAQIAFSIELNSMLATSQVPFALAFDRAQTAVQARFLWPLWKYTEWITNPNLKNDTAFIRKFAMDVVRQRREDLRNKSTVFKNSDILQMFLKHAEEHGEVITDEELADHVLNFIIAGRDTTAQALSWTFYLLAKNPQKVEPLLAEIRDSKLSAFPSYEELKTLRYTNAVFNETLRLYPSVPSNIKECIREETFPDGTTVPKGAFVTWSPYAMGRTKAIWGEDAAEFKPERWLDRATAPTQYEYPVFQGGPRLCLGKTMAQLEGVFVIVSILRKYKVECTNVDKVTYQASVTLPMKVPIMCRIEKREDPL
ncbi:cytochrome P450 [Cladochytrium replicatum]|nr:cytochrome P450 [Cladochytrium replicatum]